MKKRLLITNFLILLLPFVCFSQFHADSVKVSPYERENTNDQYMRNHTPDIDNDGIPDLVVDGGLWVNQSSAIQDAQHLIFMKGVGDGTFLEHSFFRKPGTFHSVSDFGDYNDDGNIDMIMYHFWGNGFKLYKGSGDFQFQLENTYTASTHGADARFSDYDGDGDLDIITVCSGSAAIIQMHTFTNTNGNFTKTSYALGGQDRGFAPNFYVVDINNDGMLDVASGDSGTQFIWIQRPDNSFSSFTQEWGIDYRDSNNEQFARAYSDVNDDGIIDLSFYSFPFNGKVRTNYGIEVPPYFDFATDLVTIEYPVAFTQRNGIYQTADFDMDGTMDYAFAGSSSWSPTGLDRMLILIDPYDLNGNYQLFDFEMDVETFTDFNRATSIVDVDGDTDLDVVVFCVDGMIRTFINSTLASTGGGDTDPGVVVPEEKDFKFRVYSTPGSSTFEIILDGVGNEISNSFELINNLGQLVNTYQFSGSEFKFSVEDLSNGIYYIRYENDNSDRATERIRVAH